LWRGQRATLVKQRWSRRRGTSTYRRLAAMKMPVPKAPWSAAASLPHSKLLRAFSYNVVSPKAHEIYAQGRL
jgi:hypothetical protein